MAELSKAGLVKAGVDKAGLDRAGSTSRGHRTAPGVPAARPGGRGRPGGAGRVGQGPRRDGVLPAAPAGQFRRPGGGSGHVLHRRPAHRQRVRLDRLGRLGGRRASLAARPVPAAGPAGRLGRRPRDQDVLLLRAHREGDPGRWGLPPGRAVELLLRLRPRQLGAARRHRPGRGGKARRLPHVPAAGQRLRHRRRVGHGGAARHGQQRHRGGRRLRPRAPVAELHERHPVRLPGTASQCRTAVPDPVRLHIFLRHHHPDHRHGDGCVRGPRRLPARPGAGLLRRRRRRPRTRSGRSGSPRPRPCWTGRGWRSSGT